MRLCVIPARGGSKRIPRKNIKLFNGKPMMVYSIDAALRSHCFDRVIVSTDDEEIGKIAEQYQAEIPFIRPAGLSNDHASTLPVIKHAIEWYEQQGVVFEEVCCLYATAPFVTASALQESYHQFKGTSTDYCFSVTSYEFPIQRAIKITGQNRVEMFQPENFDVRSQDLEDAYHDAGQFYWGTSAAFKNEAPFFSNRATPYILPRYLVQDIDTAEDWFRAELMYKVLLSAGQLESINE